MRAIIKVYNQCVLLFYKKYIASKFKHLIIRENTSDESVFRQIFVDKEYDIPITIKPKLIIDGGANVGYASMWFANKFPNAEIIAIEPEQSNFNVLEGNTRDLPNVKAIRAGIWHNSTNLKIKSSNFNWSGEWDFVTEEQLDSTDETVNSITISQILQESNAEEIDILKLDVEGAEKEIFTYNYEEWLGKVKILIVELHDTYKDGCREAFFSAVKNYDFDTFNKGENVVLVRK